MCGYSVYLEEDVALSNIESQESSAAKQTISNLMHPSRTVMDLVRSLVKFVERNKFSFFRC